MTRQIDGETEAPDSPRRPSPAGELGGHGTRLAINPAIARLTEWLALVGGGLMLVCIAITLLSVIGRYGFDLPVPGDYEVVEMVCAVGVFLFFPYAHATNSNIVVEFFSLGFPRRAQRTLDLAHDVVFAAVAALLAWRLSYGFAAKFLNGASTALVRIPFWWSYSIAVVAMVLLCVVCIARIIAGFRALRR